MRIDPSQLLTFLAVYEAGGFNRASTTLHKSQPALTRTVHRLEEMTQTQVFARTASGIDLTPEGRMLLTHAQVIRHELKEAEQSLSRLKSGLRTQITIGTAPVHPFNIFVKAIADLLDVQPDIDIKLTTHSEAALLSSLRDGDLSFVVLPMPESNEITGLHIEPIFATRAAIYCKPDHPLAQSAQPNIADLGKAGWILGPPGSMLRDRLDAMFASAGAKQPNVVLEVEDQRLRRILTLECPYLSVFAPHNVIGLVRTGQLVEVAYPFLQAPRPMVALALREGQPMTTAFVQLLRKRYEKSMDAGQNPVERTSAQTGSS